LLNAECVLAGLTALPENPLKRYMLVSEDAASGRRSP
jgi:hypothetical protein